jgi:phenylacetate-CoA ligase
VLLHLLPVEYSEDSDHRIRSYLQAKLRVTPQIRYISPEELQKLQFPTSGRKPLKFIDKRSFELS